MEELKICKEDLKQTKASQQEMTSLNVELDTQNHALKLRNEELCIANQSLAIQVDNLQEEARAGKDKNLNIRLELQGKLEAFQALGPPLTEELREQIYDEYRKSNELNEKVVQMFSDGYYDCRRKDKAKLVAIEADPTILDSSEDEAAT